MAVRTALGLAAGNRVDFVRQGTSFVLMPVHSDVAVLKGRFAGRVKFCMEKREVLQAAISRFKTSSSRKTGLVDALIAEIAASAGCTATMTFDKAAVRAVGMTLLV
jgi:predicted nucleic acid-binding protein